MAAHVSSGEHVSSVRLVLFDVNETLSDLSGLQGRFTGVGLPGEAVNEWFAGVLRDGFALTSLGSLASFRQLAADGVLRLLPEDAPVPAQEAVSTVLDGFLDLDVHADVVPGVRALRAAGVQLATLSNGSADVAERLLSRAGVRDLFEAVLSVEEIGIWKPAARAYRKAARRLGVPRKEIVMVAVHPWDIHGAASAGLHTAWLNRDGRSYPRSFTRPDVEVSDVGGLLAALSHADPRADEAAARRAEALTEALWAHRDFLERSAYAHRGMDVEAARRLADRLIDVLARWRDLSDFERADAEAAVAHLLDEESEEVDADARPVLLDEEERVSALERALRSRR
jgi:2-haloacid dehalogenase